MYFVYLLESMLDPSKHYIGFTERDVPLRLDEHNAGNSDHTKKYKPWKSVAYAAFESKSKAKAFEKYLKHGSGHAFAKRHFW